ncbi:MAG: hypothetical protein AVDCRST_MAG08-2880 [uncultured Acetobacteraceae bacterium]|uniref:Integral membrane protein n=1 Tax=uncultured Acetobacteraceae bacterium TaxID=169975 RepID=A0A6J4IZ85_9PROT|nr:MAG: hypothetical protein AVDCRST_MAG08-2880 [uncultured Acetobacteraceae bacterium]
MADTLHPTPFLRFALLGDAAASGATGLLLAAGAGALASLLGLPEGLLRAAGLALLPYAAFVAWIGARRGGAPRNAVRAVVIVNLLWALDSVLLLALGPVAPNGLGVAFVLAQALVVLGFAAMQWTALRGVAPSARAAA